MLKKKYRTGVLTVHKKNIKSKTPNNGVTQRNCVLYKKDGIPEHNYMSHSDDNWFGKRYKQKSLKKGLGGNLGNRDADFNQFNKSNKKLKRDRKFHKKQSKTLFIMGTHTQYHRDIKKIKKKLPKMDKKYESSNISSSSI